MKVLSITTSSSICGVSIIEDFQILKETNLDSDLTHSQTLLNLIDTTLKELNLKLSDIDLLSVDIGPGSFTGIRIGISTIKAFTDALNIPSIGVSSLEGLARNCSKEGIIYSLIDAKHENIYCQAFQNNGKHISAISEPLFTNINSLIEIINSKYSKDSIIFIGSGAISYKEQISQKVPSSIFIEENSLLAHNIGFAGVEHYNKNEVLDIQPLYLKKSEAELKLEEKQNGHK